MYLVYFCCMVKKNRYLTDKEEKDYLKSEELKQVFKDLNKKHPNPKEIKINKSKRLLKLD